MEWRIAVKILFFWREFALHSSAGRKRIESVRKRFCAAGLSVALRSWMYVHDTCVRYRILGARAKEASRISCARVGFNMWMCLCDHSIWLRVEFVKLDKRGRAVKRLMVLGKWISYLCRRLIFRALCARFRARARRCVLSLCVRAWWLLVVDGTSMRVLCAQVRGKATCCLVGRVLRSWLLLMRESGQRCDVITQLGFKTDRSVLRKCLKAWYISTVRVQHVQSRAKSRKAREVFKVLFVAFLSRRKAKRGLQKSKARSMRECVRAWGVVCIQGTVARRLKSTAHIDSLRQVIRFWASFTQRKMRENYLMLRTHRFLCRNLLLTSVRGWKSHRITVKIKIVLVNTTLQARHVDSLRLCACAWKLSAKFTSLGCAVAEQRARMWNTSLLIRILELWSADAKEDPKVCLHSYC